MLIVAFVYSTIRFRLYILLNLTGTRINIIYSYYQWQGSILVMGMGAVGLKKDRPNAILTMTNMMFL